MSRARVCDHCGAVIIVDSRGDDAEGEISAWLSVGTLDGELTHEACSRSCAIELLGDDTALTEAIELRLAAIAEVVRVLRRDDDEGEAVP